MLLAVAAKCVLSHQASSWRTQKALVEAKCVDSFGACRRL